MKLDKVNYFIRDQITLIVRIEENYFLADLR